MELHLHRYAYFLWCPFVQKNSDERFSGCSSFVLRRGARHSCMTSSLDSTRAARGRSVGMEIGLVRAQSGSGSKTRRQEFVVGA